jgi:hypothetical protein
MFCKNCGAQIDDKAVICIKCGCSTGKKMEEPACGKNISDKSRLAAALLCWFFGIIGVHRFYLGKVGSGIAQIFTLGGLGIWTLIDFIRILCGVFPDNEGRIVKKWLDE